MGVVEEDRCVGILPGFRRTEELARRLRLGRLYWLPCNCPAQQSELGCLSLGKGMWRRDRDSNPGYLAVYTLSKRAPSATRPSLRAR